MNNYLITILLFFTIILLKPEWCFSQTYNFRNYTVEEGLPQSQVFDILQDSKGYLWLATNGGGVCRFDGKQFVTFNSDNGLSENRANTIYEDSKGNIWIGTWGGLTKFDGKNFFVYDRKNGLDVQVVFSICEDDNGFIWIGTEKNGVFKFDGKTFIRQSLVGKDWDRITDFRSIIKDNNGNIWLGSGAGAFCSLPDKIIKYDNETGLCGNTIWSMEADHNGNIWFGTFGTGISKFDGKSFFSYKNYQEFVGDEIVLTIMEDDENNLWLGTDGKGVYKLDYNFGKDSIPKVSHISDKNGLLSNRVRSIFQDMEGNIWIGTDGGLSRFDRGTFTTLSKKDGLVNNTVLGIHEDKENNMWFGTEAGLSIFNGRDFHNFKAENGTIEKFVWNIKEDVHNNLWFGTYLGGVFRYDRKKLTQFAQNEGLPTDVVFALEEDRDNNIWIGSDNGIGIYNGENFKFFQESDGLKNGRVRSLLADKNGNVWIGTRNGVIKYTPSEAALPNIKDFYNISINDKIDHGVVFTIKEDAFGYIWFGSFGNGLVRYDPQSGKHELISTTDGLSDNGVVSLVLDSNYLWIGTIKGINRLNINLYHLTGNKSFKHFGKEEGFNGVECNQNSAYKDSKGNIWFGTSAGAIKYDYRYDRDNELEPATYISNVKLFYKDTDWKDFSDSIDSSTLLPLNLELPYNKNHLTFNFTGISLTIPEKVRYQFKLEGLDNEWSPFTNETYASYPSIPPGDYAFVVRACNNQGVWNKVPVAFKFKILPPFWKKTWFVSLFTVVIFLGIIGFITLRTRNLKKAKKLLMLEVRKRTKELNEKNYELELQNNVIDQKNKDITGSITYAKRIQEALFPPDQLIKESLPESFILFKPRDIVSGDFYWMAKKASNGTGAALIAAVDCTGHGVPGAFMSIVGHNGLNQAVNEYSLSKPSEILNHLNSSVKETLSQKYEEIAVKDGMDIALCSIDFRNNVLEYSGANNPLYLVRKNIVNSELAKNKNVQFYGEDMAILEADAFPIGGFIDEELRPFTNWKIDLQKGDMIYIFTDGYADQFGGEKGKKFKYKQFRDILLSVRNLEVDEQKNILDLTIEEWKGSLEQVDDILLIGVRV